MRGHRGVDVEQQEGGPAERVGLVRREGGCVGGGGRSPTVELDGERDVDDHRQQVGHGQRREYAVGRAPRHARPRQNHDIERVADDADGADDEADVAVVRRVPDRVPAQQRRHSVIDRRLRPVRVVVDPRRRRVAVRRGYVVVIAVGVE